MKSKILNLYSKRGILFCLIVICSTFSIKSQVTIGMLSPPVKGALLDLKENDEANGGANSISGLMLARVSLTDENNLYPMLTGTEPNYSSLKPRYTGLIVYNVNTTSTLEKGLNIWNGSKWERINSAQQNSILADNGLNVSGTTVKLGGDLKENTTINLQNYLLNFDTNTGKIGVNVTAPYALLDIENKVQTGDPLILKKVKLTSDPNTFDATGANYYRLVASENGVVRRGQQILTNPNESFIYNLVGGTLEGSSQQGVEINNVNDDQGVNGVTLSWKKGSAASSSNITLPETGTYIFSFRLYGHTISWTALTSRSFYITAYKNGTLYYTEEMIIHRASSYAEATYSINIAVSGNAGDNISFRVGRKTGANRWQLIAGSDKVANRTSFVFWKL